VEIAAAAAALSLIAWSAVMPAFAPPPTAPGIAKTRWRFCVRRGVGDRKERKVRRAHVRAGLRPVSPEGEKLVRNLADAAESFPSIEGADLNSLMERIRNHVREPLFPGPICRSNSTNAFGSTKLAP
jgi:hypothetical protein